MNLNVLDTCFSPYLSHVQLTGAYLQSRKQTQNGWWQSEKVWNAAALRWYCVSHGTTHHSCCGCLPKVKLETAVMNDTQSLCDGKSLHPVHMSEKNKSDSTEDINLLNSSIDVVHQLKRVERTSGCACINESPFPRTGTGNYAGKMSGFLYTERTVPNMWRQKMGQNWT